MKEFIYLNTDYINSFLAQTHGGLPNSWEEETSDSAESTKAESTIGKTITKGHTLGIPDFIGINKEIQPKRYEEINQISNTSFGREMITKIIHDNSYDLFLKDLDNDKYTFISNNIKVYDLATLSNIMENEFMDIMELQAPTAEKATASLNRATKRNPNTQAKAKELETQSKEELESIRFAVKAIKLLSKLFPSDVYAFTDGYFIPFKRSFFREEISSVNYIYTSKTNILGRVTGTVKDILNQGETSEFHKVINSLYDVGLTGLELLGIDANAKILIPISWYNE